jgi:hypothetical protein
MRIEYHEFDKTEKYILHVKHVKIYHEGDKNPEIYIETGILLSLPYSEIANDIWYECLADIHSINSEKINEVIIFLISVSKFDAEIFRSFKGYMSVWFILCHCKLVELIE